MSTSFFRKNRFLPGLFLTILAVALALPVSPVWASSDIAFIKLCARGTPEAVRSAIEAGANVNARDDDHETALMMAAEKNPNPEVTALLLRAGADVNARDEDGDTALIKAADSNSNPEVVALLLKAGADVTIRNEDGETALMEARERSFSEAGTAIVKLLQEAGAKN